MTLPMPGMRAHGGRGHAGRATLMMCICSIVALRQAAATADLIPLLVAAATANNGTEVVLLTSGVTYTASSSPRIPIFGSGFLITGPELSSSSPSQRPTLDMRGSSFEGGSNGTLTLQSLTLLISTPASLDADPFQVTGL